MLDFRVYTFLEVCKTMNYRQAAENLNLSQPSITQHIHYLENIYGCKLFNYEKKVLYKTKNAELLETAARSMIYNHNKLMNLIPVVNKERLRLGATKSIGDYYISDMISGILKKEFNPIEIYVDNTKNLLDQLDSGDLDIILTEGNFDKDKYGCSLYKNEGFLGVCSKNHKFSNKSIELKDILNETLLLREKGSGTREIFGDLLKRNNLKADNDKILIISSFVLMKKLIAKNLGITFTYKEVVGDSDLSTFTIKGIDIKHEFNYVYLKDTFSNIPCIKELVNSEGKHIYE